jgi:hypothetical protein
MRPRDELFARACAALPEPARLAVRLAELYPGDDVADLGPGEAWLAALDEGRSPESIAETLQSEARRKRAESVIGPPRKREKVTLADRRRAENARALRSVGSESDPLVVLQTLEAAALASGEEVALAGSFALLDELRHASGTELAGKLGLTPRRGQQIRAGQRAALEAGQQDLFFEDEI